MLGHETKTTTLIWNYCLGSTAAAFLLLGIFFGLIQSLFGGVQGNVPKFEKLWRIRFQSNYFGWNNSAASKK